ncbi:efflux RND transporter periplasmic adaptor subunit [Sphingomonas crocodyli]|uniref:Efflux RND transporter periplasmic adaptor subunit n=1 Tax=Sphingomonas crocodyli TaxID=1979270 RepID=A0A437M018_9SPHN|nr:efflux RND transporter periplasmic adaptor subunit [Sphingomonas crocodyli]RVT91041.1 efflux RND transporter periplasmic adaptor subunit [Sphingomonas crocodyli]
MPDLSDRNLRRYGIGAGVVALAIVAVGIGTRVMADRELADVAADNDIQSVSVIKPTRGAESDGLVLPGNVQAFNSAALYARSNGFMRRWLADIGDNVSAGQTLAIIDAPDVDQQLAAAQADYQTAAANQSLAQTTAKRWEMMLAKDAVSKQETDEKRGDLAAKTALANAQAANVKRLRALQGFTRITAPFDGVVTQRNAQIGALIVAGNAAAQPIYTVADVHRMRIYVRVPQGYSGQIRQGLHAKLTVPEYPGRTFDAVLTRTAGAVDPTSGTVLVELQVANGDRALKPGSFSQVAFPVHNAGTISLPASALMVRDDGTSVAIVGADGKARVLPVTIARDNGATVDIATGLKGTERVIDSPPDSIENGDAVRAVAAPPPAPAKG